MKKIVFALLIMFTAVQCREVKGVVCDESGTPIKGAMVSIDCSPKSRITAPSGYFSFKVKAKGKSCKIRAWNPADTLSQTTIDYYLFKKGGSVELVIKSGRYENK